jgi:recombination protein RecA
MFGNPEVTAGGNALKFYSSVRLDIRKREVLKDNEGIGVRVKVVKNKVPHYNLYAISSVFLTEYFLKVAPPFRVVEFDVLFGTGVDKNSCLLDAAEMCGFVERKGAWYYYNQTKIAQGRKAATEFLSTNTHIAAQITSLIAKSKPTPQCQPSSEHEQKVNLDGELSD